MRALIAAVLLGGCFAPQPAAGVPCADPGAAARCPSGLVCVQTGGIETCEQPGSGGDAAALDDAPVDQAPPIDACAGCLDTDDDGVADQDDNCAAMKNADQSDEDGDALGDPCDPCPINADNTDDDGDGVGNLCDPSSTTAEHIAQFVSFSTATLPAGWTAEGNVTIANGEATLVAPVAGGAYISYPSPATSFAAVWAFGTLTAFDGATLAGMGVMDRRVVGGDGCVACQLIGSAGGGGQELRIWESSTATVVDAITHPLAVGTASILRLTRESGATTYRCTASAPFVETNGASSYDPANEQVGVRVRSGTAKYRWIMILTR